MGPIQGYIRFTDDRTSRALTIGLYRNACRSELDIEQDATVQEASYYDVELLLPNMCDPTINVEIGIDEDNTVKGWGHFVRPEIVGRARLNTYSVSFRDSADRRLFWCSYGFVRLEVCVSASRAASLVFRGFTKDIPCLTTAFNDRASVITKMINSLSHHVSSPAAKWLFEGMETDDGAFSLMEGGAVTDTTATTEAYAALVGRILLTYERYLPYFSTRAFSRVIKHDELTNARSVKKAGKRELMWLARNVQQMERVGYETGISIGDEYYMPKKIRTEKTARSYNNPENRAIISFLRRVAQSLDDWRGKASQLPRANEVDPKLMESLRAYGENFPPYLILKNNSQRTVRQQDGFDSLRMKATRLLRSYTHIMPDVADEPFSTLPRRSKVFQEIKPYFDIYSLMDEWTRFGSVPLCREGLSLSTFRLDKLYEYYCLLKLLLWLNRYGFEPDKEMEHPIQSPRYTTTECHFTNEEQVATVFHLVNSKARVTLHYQPVFYGSSKEEGGITLHKTTSGLKTPLDPDADILTPDFLLTFSRLDGSNERKVVLDAKFSPSEKLVTSRDNKVPTFDKCFEKYYSNTGEKYPGRGVDAVWLLSGLDSEQTFLTREDTAWAKSTGSYISSGVVSAGPLASNLNALFKELGFSALIEIPPSTASEQPAPTPHATATQTQRSLQTPQVRSQGTSQSEHDEAAQSKAEAETQEEQAGIQSRHVQAESIQTLVPQDVPTSSTSSTGPSLEPQPAQTDAISSDDTQQSPLAGAANEEASDAQPTVKTESAWLRQFKEEKAQREAEQEKEKEIERKRQEKKAEREKEREERRKQRELDKKAETDERARAQSTAQENPEYRRQRTLDNEASELVDELIAAVDDLNKLFNGEACAALLGIEHTILRFELKEEDRYLYDPTPRTINGKDAFVFANWKKGSLKQLKSTVKGFKKARKKEATAQESKPKQGSAQKKNSVQDPIEIAKNIYLLEEDRERLFSDDFARSVRSKSKVFVRELPKNQRKDYVSFDADGKEVFVFKHWTKISTQLLSNRLETLRQ